MDHDTEIADFKWYEFTDWSKKSAAENAKAYKVYQYHSLGTDDYYQTFSPPERDFSQAWQRKDASWRKMLLMQPPVLANMEAVFGIADEYGTELRVWRLGEVVDALEETMFDYSEVVVGFSRLWD